MSEKGYFPLPDIVTVDPDLFKTAFPEWPGYLQNCAETAGSLTRRESGYLVEIAQEVRCMHLVPASCICITQLCREVSDTFRAYRWIGMRDNAMDREGEKRTRRKRDVSVSLTVSFFVFVTRTDICRKTSYDLCVFKYHTCIFFIYIEVSRAFICDRFAFAVF